VSVARRVIERLVAGPPRLVRPRAAPGNRARPELRQRGAPELPAPRPVAAQQVLLDEPGRCLDDRRRRSLELADPSGGIRGDGSGDREYAEKRRRGTRDTPGEAELADL